MNKLNRRQALITSAGAGSVFGLACGPAPALAAPAGAVAAPKVRLTADGLYRATFPTPAGDGDGRWPGGGPHTLELALPYSFEAIGAWATEYSPEKRISHAGNAVVVTRSVQLYGDKQDRCRIVFDILQARAANDGADRPYVDPSHIGVSLIGWARP